MFQLRFIHFELVNPQLVTFNSKLNTHHLSLCDLVELRGIELGASRFRPLPVDTTVLPITPQPQKFVKNKSDPISIIFLTALT